MATVSHHQIARAAKVVLDNLAESGRVTYSAFYDGSDATHADLRTKVGLESELDCPELLVDIAVSQLCSAGWVRTNELAAKLADDEQDYEIILTQTGEVAMAERRALQFQSVEV